MLRLLIYYLLLMMQINISNITEELLIEGARKSIENSRLLIDDAGLLKENFRNARAYALYQLAIEETGKGVAIMLYIIDGDIDNKAKLKDLDDEIRDHKLKTRTAGAMDWYLMESAKQSMKGNEIMNLIRGLQSEHDSTSIFNNRKNYSLYTSFINGSFQTPFETITQEELISIEFKAVFRYRYVKEWIEVGLSHLADIKEYLANNSSTLDLDALAKDFWQGVEF